MLLRLELFSQDLVMRRMGQGTRIQAADEFATPFGSNVTDSNNADGIASDNHAPIATDQSVIIYTNQATGIVLKGADPDKDPITYEIVLGPLKGTLAGFNKQTVSNIHSESNLSWI